jgi:hypothetical protein
MATGKRFAIRRWNQTLNQTPNRRALPGGFIIIL